MSVRGPTGPQNTGMISQAPPTSTKGTPPELLLPKQPDTSPPLSHLAEAYATKLADAISEASKPRDVSMDSLFTKAPPLSFCQRVMKCLGALIQPLVDCFNYMSSSSKVSHTEMEIEPLLNPQETIATLKELCIAESKNVTAALIENKTLKETIEKLASSEELTVVVQIPSPPKPSISNQELVAKGMASSSTYNPLHPSVKEPTDARAQIKELTANLASSKERVSFHQKNTESLKAQLAEVIIQVEAIRSAKAEVLDTIASFTGAYTELGESFVAQTSFANNLTNLPNTSFLRDKVTVQQKKDTLPEELAGVELSCMTLKEPIDQLNKVPRSELLSGNTKELINKVKTGLAEAGARLESLNNATSTLREWRTEKTQKNIKYDGQKNSYAAVIEHHEERMKEAKKQKPIEERVVDALLEVAKGLIGG